MKLFFPFFRGSVVSPRVSSCKKIHIEIVLTVVASLQSEVLINKKINTGFVVQATAMGFRSRGDYIQFQERKNVWFALGARTYQCLWVHLEMLRFLRGGVIIFDKNKLGIQRWREDSFFYIRTYWWLLRFYVFLSIVSMEPHNRICAIFSKGIRMESQIS